jgi:hypothetical protein
MLMIPVNGIATIMIIATTSMRGRSAMNTSDCGGEEQKNDSEVCGQDGFSERSGVCTCHVRSNADGLCVPPSYLTSQIYHWAEDRRAKSCQKSGGSLRVCDTELIKYVVWSVVTS